MRNEEWVGGWLSAKCRPPTYRSISKWFKIKSGSATNWLIPENLSDPKHETRNTKRIPPSFSRTPTSKILTSAINTKWEGDIGLYVALPLNDQPANNSKSEVGVRLKEYEKFEEFERFEVWKVSGSAVFCLLSFVLVLGSWFLVLDSWLLALDWALCNLKSLISIKYLFFCHIFVTVITQRRNKFSIVLQRY